MSADGESSNELASGGDAGANQGQSQQKASAAVTSIARAARDGVLRAAASFKSVPMDSSGHGGGDDDGTPHADVDASLIDGGEDDGLVKRQQSQLSTPQTGPSGSTEDDDSDDDEDGSPQPASPPDDGVERIEGGRANRSGSGSSRRSRSSSPVDMACSSFMGGRQNGADGCGDDDDDNRTGAFTTASAATGLIENAFRAMFASCTTGENKNGGIGGAKTAMQDAGLAPTWGMAPVRSRSQGSGERRSSLSRSRSSSRRKQRASADGGGDGEQQAPDGGGHGGSDASTAERHRRQLEGVRRARQEELMRGMRDPAATGASPNDAAAAAKAAAGGNGAILSDPGAIARLLQEEGGGAVTLNEESSVGDDGESYCYDDGISALTGMTLEDMERQARMKREVQKRKERERQRDEGEGEAAEKGGDATATARVGDPFDATFMDPRVLFPLGDAAQGQGTSGDQAPTDVKQGSTPTSAKAPSAVSAGEDYAASEVDDKLGLPPSPFDLARGRSSHTHGSRRTHTSRGSKASTAASSQSSKEFESAWRQDEAKYWADEAALDPDEAEGGEANEPGLQLEVDDASGNKGGIAPLPRPPGSRKNNPRMAARMDMVPNLEKSPSRSHQSARSTEMTAPTQELTAEPCSTVHDASAASASCSFDHHSSSRSGSGGSRSSGTGADPFFDPSHHPHDTLPALDTTPEAVGGVTSGGSAAASGSASAAAKKSKRKKKKKSRGMRLHESFVRKGARLIRAGGYYEQHEEDGDGGPIEGTSILVKGGEEVEI